MTNFQGELLYNFLKIQNPATQAVNECLTKVESLHSGYNTKLEIITQHLETLTAQSNTGATAAVPSNTPDTTTTNTQPTNTTETAPKLETPLTGAQTPSTGLTLNLQ